MSIVCPSDLFDSLLTHLYKQVSDRKEVCSICTKVNIHPINGICFTNKTIT